MLIILGLYVILWAKEYENRIKNLEIIEYDGAAMRSIRRSENMC